LNIRLEFTEMIMKKIFSRIYSSMAGARIGSFFAKPLILPLKNLSFKLSLLKTKI